MTHDDPVIMMILSTMGWIDQMILIIGLVVGMHPPSSQTPSCRVTGQMEPVGEFMLSFKIALNDHPHKHRERLAGGDPTLAVVGIHQR